MNERVFVLGKRGLYCVDLRCTCIGYLLLRGLMIWRIVGFVCYWIIAYLFYVDFFIQIEIIDKEKPRWCIYTLLDYLNNQSQNKLQIFPLHHILNWNPLRDVYQRKRPSIQQVEPMRSQSIIHIISSGLAPPTYTHSLSPSKAATYPSECICVTAGAGVKNSLRVEFYAFSRGLYRRPIFGRFQSESSPAAVLHDEWSMAIDRALRSILHDFILV